MSRYAIYYAPPPGAFADATARWLGWDAVSGTVWPPSGDLPFDQAQVTAAPRKYGFHGTLKAPFRLAAGVDLDQLLEETDALAARLAPVVIPEMALRRIKGFLALVPAAPHPGLDHLAAEIVTGLDPLRAPLNEAEIARRRPDRLSDSQRAHLMQWGYPHVMEHFQFHLSLSDDLEPDMADPVEAHLSKIILPLVLQPLPINDLCVFTEDDKGRFHLHHRSALSG